MLKVILSLLLVGSAVGQWDPNFADDRYGIVHLFEWHWDTVADECETLLAPYKVGGVQLSPPTENRIVDSRPWWERYQPIGYGFTTRSGNEDSLRSMIARCNAVGVRIYPDVVVNHMCGGGGSGTGTGGTSFNADSLDFPGVPFGSNDFHNKCEITNYGDPWQVRNCWLVNLTDLKTESNYVRGKIIDMMNHLISLGVAGFRVDACKHMEPADLAAIFGSLNNLNSDVFGSGKRAYIFQEVIDQGGEPITAGEYTPVASVTEFKYGVNIGNNRNSIQYLANFGESWGMMAGTSALVFINNHDNQRGHGGGGNIVTFEDPYDLKVLTAFMLAWPYGVPRVMSSYYFSNGDEGPPGSQRSVQSDLSCGNGWVCEHRWRQIRNMFAFSVAAIGTGVDNWWTNDNNQIAFSRGNKAFIAINKAGYNMNENLYTGLPDGSYCNVISGDFYDGKCAGWCVDVSGGSANIGISTSDDPILAIHVDAMTSDCQTGGTGGSGGSGGSGGTGGGSTGGGGSVSTTCTDCTCAGSERVDCGELASTETTCTAVGCLWCPLDDGSGSPWCFYKAQDSTTTAPSGVTGGTGGTGGGNGGTCNDCTCTTGREDCGELASTETTCTASGCLWCPLQSGSTEPWCFYPTGGSGATTTQSSGGGGATTTTTTTPSSTGQCTDCTCPSSSKVDCGYMGIDQSGCQASGCLWCESNSGDPWCFYSDGSSGGGNTGGSSSCDVPENSKNDCGYMGIDQTGCENQGCCWVESSTNGVPWCYYKA